ncbi:MAG TPA: tyrosine-type recombinase/integrase [Acidobacteriaceae bacterium]|nr:tyrosine-type recombinase/integrase [Acidobacteriaceae bacterium]
MPTICSSVYRLFFILFSSTLAGPYYRRTLTLAGLNQRMQLMRQARKRKFITENPTEDIELPDLKPVSRPTLQPDQIMALLNSIQDLHDRWLMCVALVCGTRTSETLGLQWKCFTGDRLIPCGTVYEGVFYEGKLKTARSGDSIPVPAFVRSVIDASRLVCTDASAEALMFPAKGKRNRAGQMVPLDGNDFLRSRIHPIADRLGIPNPLVDVQLMRRRTLGTDLQQHGSIKDAQQIRLRHADIQTTGNVYMQEVPQSVVHLYSPDGGCGMNLQLNLNPGALTYAD